MSHWRRWFFPGRRQVTAEVDAELEYHLEELAHALEAGGLPPETARAEALRRFGDRREVRAATIVEARRTDRIARRRQWLSELGQDLRFALRQARRAPGYTLVLLAVLSLGIGAQTAIVTAFDAVLLRPLPYREPDRLVHLWETAPELIGGRSEASFPDFLTWREQGSDLFEGLEGFDPTNVALAGSAGSRMIGGGRVTAGFLDLVGVRPILGRSFHRGEDGPGGAPVVLLGYGLWQTDYGRDPTVLGKTVVLSERSYQIVGVLPPEFHFGTYGRPEVLLPLDRSAATLSQGYNHWLNVVGRLRKGISLERARSGMATIVARIAEADPGHHATRTSLVVPLREEFTGAVGPVLVALVAAVGVLLLVACANAGSLLLARGLTRGPELRVRAALGAGRGRLARQLVAEAVAAALVAGALGAALARVAVPLIVGVIPPGAIDQVPALQHLTPDWRILTWTVIVSLVTGLAFGVLPGLSLVRRLAPGEHRTPARTRVRDTLVIGELALSVVLLVMAGLLTRSLVTLVREHPGFATEQIVTFRFSLSGPAYASAGSQQRFVESVLEAARQLPGVSQVGAVNRLPLQPGGTNTFRVEGHPEPPPGARPEATMRGVAGEYFRTMAIPLVAGRVFQRSDDESGSPVVVMGVSVAEKLFSSAAAAVGAGLRFYAFPESVWTVVGVVGDVKTAGLDEPPAATLYYSHLQAAENRMSVVARVDGSPVAVLNAGRRVLAALDPTVPFYAAETMEDRITNSPAVFLRRFPLLLIGSFAVVAVVLATAGVYGVLAFQVASRRRELGVRAALGATPGRLVEMILRRGLLLAFLGVGTGLFLSALLSRSLGALLVGLSPADPLTLLLVAGGLIAVVSLASWVPARRAARVDPALAMRTE